MRKAITAVLFRCSQTNSIAGQHQFFPRRPDFWCKYQAGKINSTNMYVEKEGHPIPVKKLNEPVFREISEPGLLAKCIDSFAQNNNEVLNQIIWQKYPKNIFVGRTVLEMGVSSAVLNFNSGCRCILDVFKVLKLEPGQFTETFCYVADAKRIVKTNVKSSHHVKLQRTKLRSKKKYAADKEEQEEETYAKGGF